MSNTRTTLSIREEDAYLFDEADEKQGVEIADGLPKGSFKIYWAEDEQWWEEV